MAYTNSQIANMIESYALEMLEVAMELRLGHIYSASENEHVSAGTHQAIQLVVPEAY